MDKTRIIQRLNPADCFALAIDEEIRKESMPGSLCGFALELNRPPNITELSNRITEFVHHFPVALASLQRHGKHFYWCKRDDPPQVFYQHHCPADVDQESFHQEVIERVMNRTEPREMIAPLEFHLISGIHKYTFYMRWIHPFCDARGAGIILKYLCTDDEHKRACFTTPNSASLVNEQLNKFSWWKKIGLILKAKRHIEKIDQLQSILPAQQQPAQSLHYAIRRLSEEQTTRISQLSHRNVGLTGTSLYYIGCIMRALDKLNPENSGEAYCAPYAFNLRKQKAINPVLGNHICALFAQAPKTLVLDRDQLFNHLKQQNAQVIRQQLDYAFLPLMWAGSWLSLEKYGKNLRRSYHTDTERTSFWFSDIGQPDLSGQTFLGAQINDMFHLCQMTSPPALGILFCQYRKRLTLSYNFVQPTISATWINALHELLLAELLDDSL